MMFDLLRYIAGYIGALCEIALAMVLGPVWEIA
jgi:hypothetical protein